MAHRRRQSSYAVVAAGDGGVFWDEPQWMAVARTGIRFRAPRPEELIELPEGVNVQFLPERQALGRRAGKLGSLGALAVAVQLPSGYTRTLLPAFRRRPEAAYLPFFGYTAVVARGDKLYCAALRTEDNPRWRPACYGAPDLPDRIARLQSQYPRNRVLRQLQTCALEYGCYNAQNIFMERWEGAVPVSPSCNAQCRGCISLQPEEYPPSPQQRFHFVPSPEEVVEIGLHHLSAPDSIYAFGQGCEGEPLLQAEVIAESIRGIRARTDMGCLHLNTNASRPDALRKVIDAGLDSIRVSLNSALAEQYHAYYQPRRYRFEQLLECLRMARGEGLYVSLNLLMMPGWNDTESECQALVDLIRDHAVDMVQLRTLNIDPDLYARFVPIAPGPPAGIVGLVDRLRRECPGLRLGNHSPPARRGQGVVPPRRTNTAKGR